MVGLECLMNVVRALGMGSCLSGDGGGAGAVSYTVASTSSPGKRRNSKKLRRNSSIESKMEMWLHRVPGRMFLNGSSEVASLFCKQGRKGINQDAMVVWENFCSKEDTIFCGVFDGHGPHGHNVAKKVRDCLPLKLSAQWELHGSGSGGGLKDVSSSTLETTKSEELSPLVDEQICSTNLPQKDDRTNIFMTLKDSFVKACKFMDKELKLHHDIDCFCSGTTAVTLVKQGKDLVIGNVGDSRAVLGTRGDDDCLVAVQLTVDLKPSLPKEAERIRLCKGRVFALRNEPEVARVWLPNCDSPGLAMARAFGDFCLKGFGLISVPDVSYHLLTEKDEFVVLATDGVWDVLSNEEVVEIVASAPRCSAAQTLVESAVRAWRVRYPTSKVDDCAVVCLFLSSDSSYADAYSMHEEQVEAPYDKFDFGNKDTTNVSVMMDQCEILKTPQ